MNIGVKIVSTGMYLPETVVTSEELDKKLGLKKGWIKKKTGVAKRYYIKAETASEMGAIAAQEALKKANYTEDDIDCIVAASGTDEQPIPCNAALIQRALGFEKSKIPCFDINSTCLSFVTALDVLSFMVAAGKYKRLLLVSSEIASVGVNYQQKESATLFGDGAVAVIIEQSSDLSFIRASSMETFSEGLTFTEIRGGGTKKPAYLFKEQSREDFLFDMDGPGVFKITSKVIVPFVENLLTQANLTMNEVDLVIPHQASGMAMRVIQKKLGISNQKFMNIIEDYGNMIAASIPLALHVAITSGKVKRGDTVMLLGTSAGVSLGGVIFDY